MNVARFSSEGVADTSRRRQVTLPAPEHVVLSHNSLAGFAHAGLNLASNAFYAQK
jgi:hypothetical protein